ncbi:MAG: hypothetical protein NVS4B3_09030 [Gemmatimonadaceae bacterium]
MRLGSLSIERLGVDGTHGAVENPRYIARLADRKVLDLPREGRESSHGSAFKMCRHVPRRNAALEVNRTPRTETVLSAWGVFRGAVESV